MSQANPKKGGNTGTLAARKQLRREEAEARQAAHDKRSDLDQAEILAKRPGGSKRERDRRGLHF